MNTKIIRFPMDAVVRWPPAMVELEKLRANGVTLTAKMELEIERRSTVDMVDWVRRYPDLEELRALAHEPTPDSVEEARSMLRASIEHLEAAQAAASGDEVFIPKTTKDGASFGELIRDLDASIDEARLTQELREAAELEFQGR